MQQNYDGGGSRFQGLLTLTNLGGAAVSGWTLQLSFPGDSIKWVGQQGFYTPFDTWAYNGGALTLTAADSGEALAPGGTEQIVISGHGTASTPVGCSFDGAACTP